LLFYAIFYTILALFSAGLFSLFYLTIEDHKPKWTLQESLIKDNPGLGFRPMPPPSNVDSTLIWFRKSANGVRYWQTEIERFRSQSMF
jgi:sodium/potassium-transporting ATPase subunit beta